MKATTRLPGHLSTLLAFALVGCGPLSQLKFGQASLPVTLNASGSADTTQSAEPPVLPAADQVVAASANILGKNSSKFAGNVLIPAGILGKNSSKFRIESLQQVPGSGLWVLLQTPTGYYYADSSGRPYWARTDASGRYSFASTAIPVGQDVVVTVETPGSAPLYLEAYTKSQSDDNLVDVNLATTCTSGYFLSQAKKSQRDPSTFDLTRLPQLTASTQGLLDSGALTVGSDLLTLPARTQLVATYANALGTAPALAAQWQAFLGAASPSPTPTPNSEPGSNVPPTGP